VLVWRARTVRLGGTISEAGTIARTRLKVKPLLSVKSGRPQERGKNHPDLLQHRARRRVERSTTGQSVSSCSRFGDLIGEQEKRSGRAGGPSGVQGLPAQLGDGRVAWIRRLNARVRNCPGRADTDDRGYGIMTAGLRRGERLGGAWLPRKAERYAGEASDRQFGYLPSADCHATPDRRDVSSRSASDQGDGHHRVKAEEVGLALRNGEHPIRLRPSSRRPCGVATSRRDEPLLLLSTAHKLVTTNDQ